MTEALAGIDRISEILKIPTELEDDSKREAVGSISGDVDFENVWFEYNRGEPVLRGVTFQAPAGTTTALVGSSGSGKSTLIGLVMGFSRPTKGRVLVDSRDLITLRIGEYRRQLASVLQDNFLFDGTIAENVSYPRASATRDEVREACRLAHCDEFIERFPQQYETIVGERGIMLSGGQRQRVSIARAILSGPRILILDEATSSLDSESEQLIQDALKSLRSGRTTFVIAHRLSTIRNADQILVLEGGTIVERGTHDELMLLNQRYRHLYDKQYEVESDQFSNPGEGRSPERVARRAPALKRPMEGVHLPVL
jgi:subfamily B ATP-binding cassette protein MsbA